jgi:hypothetical protein
MIATAVTSLVIDAIRNIESVCIGSAGSVAAAP